MLNCYQEKQNRTECTVSQQAQEGKSASLRKRTKITLSSGHHVLCQSSMVALSYSDCRSLLFSAETAANNHSVKILSLMQKQCKSKEYAMNSGYLI